MKTAMKKNRESDGIAGRRGSALLIVMCFSAILLMTCLALHKMSTGLAYTVGNFRKGGQALALAEAGVSDILQKQASDFETWKSSTLSNSFGGGSYVVTAVTNGRTGSIITSVGTYDGTTRETVLETLGDWMSAWDTNIFGTYGIFSAGLIDGNGNGVLHSSLFSNDGIAIAPNVTIEGDVSSVGTVNIQGTVTGSTNEMAEPIETPTFSFDYYRNIATNYGGDYYTNSQTFMNETVWPVSGVTCVNGDVMIKNNAIIKGAIVAWGDILMTGGDISHDELADPSDPSKALPSLMSITGNVRVNGGQTLNGFIYAAGDVVINGGDTVYGGIICGGVVDARGDWEIFPGDGTVPPGINPAEGGEVTKLRIGAWLR